MTDIDEQTDELLALTSIYDAETIDVLMRDGQHRGSVSVETEIPQPFNVAVKDREGTEHAIQHLPYIVLTLKLPPDYPSVNPPDYALSCPWLTQSQLSDLSDELKLKWESNVGSVVLFTWIGFLQSESLGFLEIESPLFLGERELQDVLDHDRTRRDLTFAGTIFLCQVCLCEKPGSACTRFYECEHVFCRACIRDYFELHIADGTISLLKCPQEKCASQAHPTQVKELVTQKLFERYDRLLLQVSLETMNDIVYCPRKACGCPVVFDKDNAMASCPSCHYVFCIYCKMVYHGIARCRMKSETMKLIRTTYLAGSDDEQKQLEKQYGKKSLQALIEDGFTEDWLEQNSKKCPRCCAQIQKIDGCNKMACSKCGAYFCWLCLSVLPHDKPYDHFNKPTSPCFNKLFRGVNDTEQEGDIDDPDFDFFDLDPDGEWGRLFRR